MKDNHFHGLSSSDEDMEEKGVKKASTNEPQPKDQVSDMLSQKNGEVLDFNALNEYDTLFEEDISENDEIWMVTTPPEIDASSLSKVSINFDSSVSKMKCKVNNTKTRFKVYTMTNPSSTVNLLLPSRKTKSFRLKTYPTNGKIILQKSLRFKADEK